MSCNPILIQHVLIIWNIWNSWSFGRWSWFPVAQKKRQNIGQFLGSSLSLAVKFPVEDRVIFQYTYLIMLAFLLHFGVPSGFYVYMTNWKDPPFLIGKTHELSMAIFDSYVNHYQRVLLFILGCLPRVSARWLVRGKTQQLGRHDNFGPGVATTRWRSWEFLGEKGCFGCLTLW